MPEGEEAAHHFIVPRLGGRVPRLIILHVAVICMVCPVADAPSVVWHQDAAVRDVSHDVIELLVAAEAAVATAGTQETNPQQSEHHLK